MLKKVLVVLGILSGLAAVSPVRAALDPELKRPYQLQVVLHIAENRFLTAIFQDQVERELRDHLQLTYGALAKVEVVRTHPLLRDPRKGVLAKGLQQALDGWEELSERKTHFVLIDYVDGRYELQARQHDGLTGLNSPVVRRDRTSERRLVSAKAARLVDRDFGLVGTVVESAKEVKLALRGGGLGVPLNRWVKPGEVFAIARISRQGDKLRAERLPWALLQVLDEPRQGFCRCRFYHRFQEDRLSEGAGAIGYRCLKLATAAVPLRLRLIDDQTFQPLNGLQVHVGREGFESKPRQLTTNQDGLASTKESFAHVAFVSVLRGDNIHAQIPIELVDQRTVVCRLRISNPLETLEALEFRRDSWVRRVYDNLRLAAERVTELNGQVNKSLEGALASARDGLKDLDSELDNLALERDQLQRQSADKKLPPGRLDLGEGEMRLEDLRTERQQLDLFVARLEKAIKVAQSDETRDLIAMRERARLLERQAEFDQAIKLYEKILLARPDQSKVRSYLGDLKKAWAVKGPEHAKAREFIYKTWSSLDVGGLKAKLPDCKKAFDICRQNGDRLAPRKLLRANLVHADNLKKRRAVLKRQDTEDNLAEAKNISQIADGLMRLHDEVRAYLEPGKKSPPK